MAELKGRVVPPNVLDILIQNGLGTQDFLGFLNNLAKTAPLSGSGTPESNVEGAFLQRYVDIDAVATPGTFEYVKTTPAGKTGWKLT